MNNGNPADVSKVYSASFKYKSTSIGESTAVGDKRIFRNVTTAVPLTYLTSFFRSLQMPLINCKIHIELN